ncbi:MAG: GNAT family N-acetyltransferase [Desulfobaccales bacterium]
MKKILLDCFFKPESVAVIGASEKEGSVGSILVQNLMRGGFPGSIFPVNRNYAQIHGLTAQAAITALPAPADLAIIAIPIKDVMEANRETAEFAVMVADQWQGKGLGAELVEEVIGIAKENQVKLLWGEVLSSNKTMLDLVKRLGFTLIRQAEAQTFRAELQF